jgi:hypothetical protein
MKNFHITFYYDRTEPLLGGHTVEADTIVSAIGRFLLETEVHVDDIKYVVEV